MTDPVREFAAWDEGQANEVIDALKDLAGAGLPVLHALQHEFGYIHDDAIPLVAEALNLSKAEIVGVVEFYTDFRRTPPARHTVRVCLAEACQSMGSARVVAELTSSLGIGIGEVTPDQAVEIEAVYCLGNCALAPAMVVDGKLFGRLQPGVAAHRLAGRLG